MQINKTVCDYCEKALKEGGKILSGTHLSISFESYSDYKWEMESGVAVFTLKNLNGDYCDIGCFTKAFKKFKASEEKEYGQ